MPKTVLHDEPTEEYKAALAAKEAQRKKEQQERSAKEIRAKQSAAKAKRKMEAKKKELQNELANKKIAECNAKIARAEKTLESEKAYDLIAKIALWLSAFMVAVAALAFFAGPGVDSALIAMVIAFMLICFSVFFQTKSSFATKKIAENRKRITKIRQELYAIKNRR